MENMTMITAAVEQGIKDFKACASDPLVQSFMVSQQCRAVPAARSHDAQAWLEAYSARATPAMLATPGTINAA
eukprot:8732673-Pyramimonas_sp.AAC.1